LKEPASAFYSYGGWYDDFRREAFVASTSLHNPSKLLIGPWGHCQNDGLDLITERLRFFDYWLKGIDNGIMKEPKIYYHTVGAPEGTEWRFTSQWPLPDERTTKYYLQAGGALEQTRLRALEERMTIPSAMTLPAPNRWDWVRHVSWIIKALHTQVRP